MEHSFCLEDIQSEQVSSIVFMWARTQGTSFHHHFLSSHFMIDIEFV